MTGLVQLDLKCVLLIVKARCWKNKVQSLKLEGYFHIHLLRVEHFSLLTFNHSHSSNCVYDPPQLHPGFLLQYI